MKRRDKAMREAFDGQLEAHLYAYRLDAAENGKWLFFDTLKLDFFSKKNKTAKTSIYPWALAVIST